MQTRKKPIISPTDIPALELHQDRYQLHRFLVFHSLLYVQHSLLLKWINAIPIRKRSEPGSARTKVPVVYMFLFITREIFALLFGIFKCAKEKRLICLIKNKSGCIMEWSVEHWHASAKSFNPKSLQKSEL